MFNEDGSHTDYYKTAKRVYQYMIKQKDEHNIEWPILVICQGFEVIHYLTNDDKPDTLSKVEIYRKSLPLEWKIDEPKSTRFFKDFPEQMLEVMATEPVQVHAHTWVVKTNLYELNPAVADFF